MGVKEEKQLENIYLAAFILEIKFTFSLERSDQNVTTRQ